MKFIHFKLALLSVLLLTGVWWGVWWLPDSTPAAVAKSVESVVTAPVSAPDIATIPTAFSYQGTLRLADGSLPTGSYNITLKLYSTVTGGTALHSESFSNTVVRNGNFSVIVGDATPIAVAVFDNANLYIGVTVAPDPEMLPRQRLYPVPWAMQAGAANTANSADVATTLVKDATIDGLTINKGATNEGALKVTSSGPGWGSGIRFQNTAANRTYGIYTDPTGIWHFVDETVGADRFFVDPTGQFHTRQAIVADGDIASGGNMSTAGNFTAGASIVAGVNIVAGGKVYATFGFNGFCRGPGPIDVRCDQDVAETFATDERIDPGNLVVFIPEDRTFPAVRPSSKAYEGAIVGVVSTSPGLVFDQGKTYLAGDNTNLITDKKTVVAMVGRVPTRFSLENGPIAVGDPLTSSSTPGAAMKATAAGQIIGYAMQSSDAAEDDKLLVWLQLGAYIPPETLAALNHSALPTAGGADLSMAELKAQLTELSAQVVELSTLVDQLQAEQR